MWRGLAAVGASHAMVLAATAPRGAEALARHLLALESYPLMVLYLVVAWPRLPDSYRDDRAAPCPGAVLAQLAVFDLAGWLLHRAEHRWRGLYRLTHSHHHRIQHPRVLDAFRGSVADTAMLILVPLQVTAWSLHLLGCAVRFWSFVVFGVLFSTHFLLIHHAGAVRYHRACRAAGVVTYDDHHTHHVRRKCNFGHIFTLWDRAAGTFAATAPRDALFFRPAPAAAPRSEAAAPPRC